MPIVEALILVQNRVEKLRKLDEPPPGRIGSIMRIIADGRMATLLEVEQVIEWLEEKRIKLGGRARKYESDESTEKLKDTISQLFGGSKNGQQPRGNAARVPAAVRDPVQIKPDPVAAYIPSGPAQAASVGRPAAPPTEYRPMSGYAGYQSTRETHTALSAIDNAPPLMQQQPPYQTYRNHYEASNGSLQPEVDGYNPPPRLPQRAYAPDNNVVYGSTRSSSSIPTTYDEPSPYPPRHHPQHQPHRHPQQQPPQYAQQHGGYY